MGTLEGSYLAFPAILWLRRVPVGVVYARNNVIIFKSEMVPTTDWNGKRTVSNFDNDGACPVQYCFSCGATQQLQVEYQVIKSGSTANRQVVVLPLHLVPFPDPRLGTRLHLVSSQTLVWV